MQISEVPELFDDPRVIVLSAQPVEAALAELGPREAEAVARAIDKRRLEFATGRALARCALARLGVPEVEILSDADRAPIWPDGITGSISHCDNRVVVALGRRSEVGSVGIDVEHRNGLRHELWRSVFLREEIEALERAFGDPTERERMALVAFAAKEALYKAQFPISRTFMGFMALHVGLEPAGASDGVLTCTFRIDVPPFLAGDVVRGRYRIGALPGCEVLAAVRIVDRGTASRPGAPDTR